MLNQIPALRQTAVIASTDLNRIHHANFLDNNLPDKCAKLIIADPPYFEIKGAFDFIWEDMKAYLKDVEKWAIECKRLLSDNGTLFWYGHAKNIAYAQVIFDLHFNLINNLVWDKGSFMGLEESEGLRSFAPCTERILMYGSKAQDTTGLKEVEMEYVAPRNPFALELKKARLKKAVSINQVAEYGRIIQLGLTVEQNRVLNLIIAQMSKEIPLVKMGKEYDLVLKSSLCNKCSKTVL